MIVVTGGAGFIGAHLVAKLLLKGEKVLVIDIKPKPNIDNPNYVYHKQDVCELEYLNANGNRIDAIYHLACHASPPRYQKDPLHTIRTCTIGSINVLRIAMLHQCPVLLTSTSEVYGEPMVTPQSEEYRGNVSTIGPRACYDEGKRIAETIFSEYHKRYGVDIRIARIFNTYGPGMDIDDGRVVTNFIDSLKNEKPVVVYGDGLQTRSFCYVSDTVNGLIGLMKSRCTSPVNIGNPYEITIKQLLETLIHIIRPDSYEVENRSPRTHDPTHRCPDITSAMTILRWKPKVSLEEGLIRTVAGY